MNNDHLHFLFLSVLTLFIVGLTLTLKNPIITIAVIISLIITLATSLPQKK